MTAQSHLTDPATAREAGARLETTEPSADEIAVLVALAEHPATAHELAAVFPRWRDGHAAKRASQLKKRGLVEHGDTRRLWPGRARPATVYRLTDRGWFKLRRVKPWTGTPGPADLIAQARELLERELLVAPATDAWPCPYCTLTRPTRAGIIHHFQRGHGIPVVDRDTGKALS